MKIGIDIDGVILDPKGKGIFQQTGTKLYLFTGILSR